MTHIWYEVFPVTLIDRHAMLLQDATHFNCSPWMLSHQSNIHPNIVVIDYLKTALGPFVCREKTIVHSTSWRYDTTHDWMLLTYLAILPQIHWQARSQSVRSLIFTPIGEITASYGNQLFPPEQIERQHALAHALDHLAALNTYDTSIQTALETGWQDILQLRQPKPAGCLQKSPVQAAPSGPSTRELTEMAVSSVLAVRAEECTL